MFDDYDVPMKEMDLYTLFRILDVNRKNKVKKKTFVREIGKILKVKAVKQDLESEMRDFKEHFNRIELKPL